MADLRPERASSSREGNVADNSSSESETGEADSATRPASAKPALPAALDKLRDAAKAHDAQLPPPCIPLLTDRAA
jgi:hypothetical protein